MNFSFPPLPARLADPRLRRWGPALLAALFCQLLLLQALRPAGPEVRRGRRAALADDTPTLLRWSRTPTRLAEAAGLQSIPLQGLSALPPPPPSSLPGAAPESLPAAPSRSQPAAPASAAPGLPRQPGEAFRLARQVAQAESPAQPSLALVALQRRQWWLLPGQDQALQALWDGGQEQILPPAQGPAPQDMALRSVNAVDAGKLALGELHGRSLVDGNQVWLFWRQGSSLWLLRGALARPSAAPNPG